MESKAPPAPPTHTPPVSSSAQQAAKTSWLAPLIVIIFNFVIKNASLPPSQARSRVIAVVSPLPYLGGLVRAVYALAQLRRAGRKGVLAPARARLAPHG